MEQMSDGNRSGGPLGKRLTRLTGLAPKELLIALLAVLVIKATDTGMVWLIESRYRQAVGDALQTLLESREQAMHLWASDQKQVAVNLARGEELVAATRVLLATPPNLRDLLASPAQRALRDLFQGYLKGGHLRGYFIISPSNISLASSREGNVGSENLLASQPDVLDRLWRGETVLSRVQHSRLPLPEQRPIEAGTRDITLFVGTPIRDAAGRVIALLTLRIDPNLTLFPLLRRPKLGESDESYVFDRDGTMLSPSRFTDELITRGLLAPGQSGALRIRLEDRGQAIRESGGKPALTRMAANATQGRRGSDVTGYSNYLGTPVVGAWLWDEDLNIGLATEQSVDEAYATFYLTRDLIIGAGLVAVAVLLFVVYSFGVGRRRLRDTENRLAALVESAVDSIIVIDPRGVIESVNPATTRMFGHEPGALIGRNVSLLMPQPHQAAHDGYLARYMQTGEARVIGVGRAVQALRADGTLFPAELAVSRLELDSGLHFAGIIRDISSRRQAEDNLRREKEAAEAANKTLSLTQTALDRAGIGELWINAGSGALLRVNDHTCQTLGYSREELLAMTIPDIDPAFSGEAYRQEMLRIRDQGWGRFESSHRARDGSLIPMEIIVMYAAGEQSDADLMVAFAVDIAARRRTEETLRRIAEELRMMSLVAAKTDNGVVLTGLDQRIKWINPGFTVISGYSPEEVIGKKPGELLQGPETDRETIRRVGEAVARHERVEAEVINYHKNGTPYWVHIEITPVRNEAGEVVEFIALEMDVTARREAGVKLLKAKEEAEAANRAKSVFLATMSHEIRTPLNGVVGTIDLLNHSSLNTGQRDLVNTARESSLALLTIIDDILDFSKIEAGRLELEQVPLSLERVVEGVADTLQSLARKNAVDLLVYCDPAIPEVLGDPVRLRQIVLNLVGNAIKFTGNRPTQECLVRVEAIPIAVTPTQAEIRISVRDTGIGMTPEVMQRLFQPFVQAEGSTTRRFGGTGLGLVISRRLAELMGGDIEGESREGVGSVFTLRLTLAVTPTSAAATAPILSGLSVVLVEGDPHATPILASYIRHAGAEVMTLSPCEMPRRLASLREAGASLLLVIDNQGDDADSLALREAALAHSGDTSIRFLVVGRGRRRLARPAGEDSLTLDLNAMRRGSLINAVAALAGRESPVLGEREPHLEIVAAEPLSIEEAEARGRLILLAEDNETNQEVIRQQLRLLGYTCEIAGDGRSALERWRSGRHALLLTDCHMPAMDGYDLTRAIRAEEGDDKRIPIIAITADAMKGAAARCLAAGMDDYLSKPMQLADLRVMLDKWLPRPTPSPESPALAATTAADGEAVDPKALSDMLGIDDGAVLARFYADFLRSGSEVASQLQAAHMAGNDEQVGRLAHKLKSSARTVGAHALADCCQALEQASHAKDPASLALKMQQFSPLMQSVKTWIERFASLQLSNG